jgi:cobalt-precorrin 5A hydrolase/precorrin-3B C17-methyltransferase
VKRKRADEKKNTLVYPITLHNLHQRLSVVIGGGPVAERKVAGLLAAGAQVRLIAPQATPQLIAWAQAGRLHWLARPYQPGDLTGAFLVFAATNQRAVNQQVAQDAAASGALCNVADAPQEGDFHLPAVLRTEDLTIAVSTSGRDPRRAKAVRDQIAAGLQGFPNDKDDLEKL